jgi:hypothetical protein
MTRLIFTIYIDVPPEHLDNPASWNNETGELGSSDKSAHTKDQLALWKDRLIAKQKKYADFCGAEYIVYDDAEHFRHFYEDIAKLPQHGISWYDGMNFYKHYLMNANAQNGRYDEICYFDLDVVPLSSICLFDEFDFSMMHVGESNAESMWGRNVELEFYNACIRNPASKYFNCQALAADFDVTATPNVFNTGIMFGGAQVIVDLDYFNDFQNTLHIMTDLRDDEDSMYPWVIRRSFGHDNETLFGYRIAASEIPYETLPIIWNTTDLRPKALDVAELVHVISKDFRHVL